MSNESNEQQDTKTGQLNKISRDEPDPNDPIESLAVRGKVIIILSCIYFFVIAVFGTLATVKCFTDRNGMLGYIIVTVFLCAIQCFLINSLGRGLKIASETARKVEEIEKKMKQ